MAPQVSTSVSRNADGRIDLAQCSLRSRNRQGRYAEALQEARQIDAPGWIHNHTVLGMIYGQLGQEEPARAATRQILQMDPEFEENAWYELQLRNFPEQMADHMIDGLRKAGLSIPAQPPQDSDPSS